MTPRSAESVGRASRRAPAWGVVVCAIVVSLFAVAIPAGRWRSAELASRSASERLVQLGDEARELRRLRSMGEDVSTGQRPTHDTLARVNRALGRAGIAPGRLKELASESDGPAHQGDSSSRVQTMRMTLEPVGIAEVGSFLAQWRIGPNPWAVARVELSHVGPPDDQIERYSAQIVIAAAYRAGPDVAVGTSASEQRAMKAEDYR